MGVLLRNPQLATAEDWASKRIAVRPQERGVDSSEWDGLFSDRSSDHGSTEGLFIALVETSSLWDRLGAGLDWLGPLSSIRALLEVRWVGHGNESSDEIPGIGVSVVDLTDDVRALIEPYIRATDDAVD